MKKQRDHPVLFLRFKSIRPRYKPEAPPPAPEPICGLTHAVDQFPPRPHRIFFYSVLIHEIAPLINVRIHIKSVRTPTNPALLLVQYPADQSSAGQCPTGQSPAGLVLLPVRSDGRISPSIGSAPPQILLPCRFTTASGLR